MLRRYIRDRRDPFPPPRSSPSTGPRRESRGPCGLLKSHRGRRGQIHGDLRGSTDSGAGGGKWIAGHGGGAAAGGGKYQVQRPLFYTFLVVFKEGIFSTVALFFCGGTFVLVTLLSFLVELVDCWLTVVLVCSS